MDQKAKNYIMYIVGIVSAVAGVSYLAAEYVENLSEPGKLGALILLACVFGAMGKYFYDKGQ